MRDAQAAIAAVYELRPGRYPEHDALGMYRRVIADALADWRLRPSDVDGVLASPAGIAIGGAPDIFTHEKMVEDLGIEARVAESISAGGATYSIMVQRAAAMIAMGQAESVLCVGAGRFPNVGAGAGEAMARIVSDPDFEFIYGAFVPAIYALAASQYSAEYGDCREGLTAVAMSARRWAVRNPQAVMQSKGELTAEQILASRPIAGPFRMLDCSFPCEGGGAFLVTSSERARRITPQPAYVLGMGECHVYSSISQARSLLHTGAAPAGAAAFTAAGMAPSEVSVAELYDAFTINPLILLEDLGFCGRGKAARMVADGATDPGGSLPMNTNGGLLSFGHTGDASGLSVLVEGVRQVMGTGGPVQVDHVETAAVHTYGGMMGEHATLVLGRTA